MFMDFRHWGHELVLLGLDLARVLKSWFIVNLLFLRGDHHSFFRWSVAAIVIDIG